MKNRHFRVFIMIRISQTFLFRKIMFTTTRYRLDFCWLRRKLRLPFYSFWSLVVLGKTCRRNRIKGPNLKSINSWKIYFLWCLKWGVEKGIWSTHTQQKISKQRLFSIFLALNFPGAHLLQNTKKNHKIRVGEIVCVFGGVGVCVGVWVCNQDWNMSH